MGWSESLHEATLIGRFYVEDTASSSNSLVRRSCRVHRCSEAAFSGHRCERFLLCSSIYNVSSGLLAKSFEPLGADHTALPCKGENVPHGGALTGRELADILDNGLFCAWEVCQDLVVKLLYLLEVFVRIRRAHLAFGEESLGNVVDGDATHGRRFFSRCSVSKE